MRSKTLGALAVIGVVTFASAPARAQDRDEYRNRRTVPASVAAELVDVYNAERTRRLRGPATIEDDEDIRGDVAVLDGTLTVRGLVRGRIIAINANVRLTRGARVEGDILIGGGYLEGRSDGWVGGEVRTYADRVAYRRDGVMLIAEEGHDRDLAWWSDFKSRDGLRTSINFGGANTYNRVEGLPINLGPQIRTDFKSGRFLLDAQVVLRTIQGWNWNPQTVGHRVRAELRLGQRNGIAFGGRLFDVVDGVENWQMSDAEVGLGAFLFQRDFRDYYLKHGGQAYVRLFSGDGGEVTVGYGHEQWKNAELTNVFSLFKLDGGWRPLPTMDEADMHLVTARWQFDTRNDLDDPTNGWWIQADYERGEGKIRRIGAIAPFPAAILAATPFTDISYSRGFLDFRRYTRVGPDAQLNFRVVGGGQLPGSDALPMQRKLSVSGPGSLAGFAFRQDSPTLLNVSECVVAQLPGTPANCDRMLLAQLEFKGSLDFNLFNDIFDHYDAGALGYQPRPRKQSRMRSGHWVIFADAGRGWLVGASPIPGLGVSGKIPSLDTFRTDAGLGFDFGPIGLYYAKAMSDQQRPGVFFLRLHSRF